MRITLTFDNPELTEKYEELGETSVFGPVSVLEDFPKTEILVMNSFYPIDKKILNWMKNLKAIATPTTGLDHIDLEECEKREIKVISLKGETEFLKEIPSVAELTIWFMLELLRRPHGGRFMGNELNGKIVGLVGAEGRIAKQVKKRLEPFGVGFIEMDKLYGNWGSLASKADMLSLHVPLNKNTEDMIEEEHLRMMKPTAGLVNTSRAQLIEREPLLRAIREKWIAGYGTDVVRDDQEWQDLEKLQKEGFNVVLTKHIGGFTVEARQATDEFIFKKVEEVVKSRNL